MDAEFCHGAKPEPCVVPRVADEEHGRESCGSAAVQGFLHEERADAAASVVRGDAQWCDFKGVHWACCAVDHDSGGEDVADDPVVEGDEFLLG